MDILSKGIWLNDIHLNAAFTILYEQVLENKGFQKHVVRLDLRDDLIRTVTAPCLQFYHHKRDEHWILTYFYPQNDCNHGCIVYDSLGRHSLDKGIVQKLMGTPDIPIRYAKVQQQGDGESCGFFVIAWAVDIAFGYNPEESVYVKTEMRRHLWWCLNSMQMLPFPRS